MKRQLAYLGILPLLWLASGCTPHEYYRGSHYQGQYRSYSYKQAPPADRYRRPRRQVSNRALRKYRRYELRCQRSINKCQYRTRVIRRAIRRVRSQMYYQTNPHQFDRSRARLQFYYRNIRKYHRCVTTYSYRMRWARAYFQRRFGVDPKRLHRRKRRFATRPRRGAKRPRRNSSRWAQPPAGDLHANRRPHFHKHGHPGQHDHGLTTPRATPPTPRIVAPRKTPPAVRGYHTPDPVKPTPQPVKPDLQPAPRVVPPTQPTPQTMPNTVQVRRWLQYCMQERRKYPMQVKLRYRSQSSIQLGKHQWHSRAYAHNDIAAIQPLRSSHGRYVVLGADGRYSQAHCEDRTFHVWDSRRHRSLKLRPPVTAFLLRNTHLVPWFSGKKHASIDEKLLYYNPSAGRAGLMIKAAFPAMKRRSRFLYLVWDLRSNRITHSWTLGTPGCHSAYRTVGVTPDGTKLYYLMNDLRVAVKCDPVSRGIAKANAHRYAQKLMSLNLTNGRRRMVSRFADSRKRFDTFLPNRNFTKVAIVEYAELAPKRGKVFLVDTRSGRVKRFSAPLTPYGVTFSTDQRSLLIYNSKRGKLVRINLASGQQKAHKTHRMGHAMGLSRDGRHVYLIFHGGVEVRDAQTLKRIDYLAHRKMMGNIKFIHVDGSKISGGVLFVKNGEKLFVQRLQLRGKVGNIGTKAKPGVQLRNQIHGLPAPQTKQKKAPAPAPRLRKKTPQTRPAIPHSERLKYIEY